MSTIDWNALKKTADDATKPAPPDDYTCEITKCEATSAASSGNPMLKATMKIVDGPYAGKTVFNNFNLTLDHAFAMSIFFRHMAAFGLTDEFFAQGPEMDQVAAALVGRRARVTLSIRQWQGQDRNQVDNVQPIPGVPAGGPGSSVPVIATGPSGMTPTTPGPVPASPASPATPVVPTTPTAPTTPGVPALPTPAF